MNDQGPDVETPPRPPAAVGGAAPGAPAAPPAKPLEPADQAAISDFLRNPAALAVPPVESPFFEAMLEQADVPAEVLGWARRFREDGYLVLEDFFDAGLIDEICAQFPWLFDPATVFDAPRFVQDLLRMDDRRRQDAWWVSDPVKRLACDDRILALLELLYGRKVLPFQTLDFLYGTEQSTHSDAIHFSSMPARYMCGVWVALEDITEENGPLHYYPGSHRIPDIRLEELGVWGHDGPSALCEQYRRYENYVRALIRAQGLEQKRLTCRKGTALVWSNGLLHGGCEVVRKGSTRMSQVTHYYFEDCVYWSPINSNSALGEYRLKEVHDLRTQERVPHTLNGEPLRLIPATGGNHRIMRKGDEESWIVRPDLPHHVLSIVEQQMRAVQEAPKLKPLERAQTLARLCEVALKAAGRPGPGP